MVADRGEPTDPSGPEGDSLSGRRLMSAGGEHLRPGQHQLDRTASHARRCRGEQRVRPHEGLTAEPATDVGTNHPDVVGRQPKCRREHHPRTEDPLGGVAHGELVTVPVGQGRRGLYRIMVPVGGSVGGGDHGVRAGQPGIDVAHHIIRARQDPQPASGHSAPRTRRQSHSTCQDLQSQHLSIELPAHPPWPGKEATDRGHGLASTER